MSVPIHTQSSSPVGHPALQFRGGIYCYRPGTPPLAEETFQTGFDPWQREAVEPPGSGISLAGRFISAIPEDGRADLELTCNVSPGHYHLGAFFFALDFERWTRQTYLLLPGAAYNGNRYESRRIPYSPKLKDPEDIGVSVPPIVSDIPRLNIRPGPSRIHVPAGVLSLPAVGIYFPEREEGWMIQFDPVSQWGIRGIRVEEDLSGRGGSITIQSPLVRSPDRYRICDNRWPSEDIPADLQPGAGERLLLRLFIFHKNSVQGLFDHFFLHRDLLTGPPDLKMWFPMSEVFRVIEDKYNLQNWVEPDGYYSVGMRENFLQDWQIGWTGGLIATLPLLARGDKNSESRVLSNFDWIFRDGISPSGFFWDSGEKGSIWYGGDIRHPHTKNWHLVRKSGDGLFYVLKQFILMERKGIEVKEVWKRRTQEVAEAFCRLWEQFGQLGQFIHNLTGEIIVGGSTSGAIVPAALMLAADQYGNERYRRLALEIGEYFYTEFVCRGISQGGPGDALQCPDSESAYALVESFVRLYEGTGENIWLERAGEMARQFSTWVFGWTFPFPPRSTSGKLGNNTRGAVMANTQNLHPAPGICTYSGQALFRLARYTGDERYARLLEEITRQIPQNLSHPDRPIPGLRSGWISERINTSDWLEGEGEIMEGSTWSEVSAMLVSSEIPSVYLHVKHNSLWIFDHLQATLEADSGSGEGRLLRIINPTAYQAQVNLCVEHGSDSLVPFDEFFLSEPPLVIAPGGSVEIHF